jgi:hypothetical protein
MYRISLIVLFALITGCKKDEILPVEEKFVFQKVLFIVSPNQDNSGFPDNYYINIKLELSRRDWTGVDIPVWDTIIRKKQVKSLQSFEVPHVMKTNQSTGILTAISYIESFYGDNPPFWVESTSTKLDYNKQDHTVSVKF